MLTFSFLWPKIRSCVVYPNFAWDSFLSCIDSLLLWQQNEAKARPGGYTQFTLWFHPRTQTEAATFVFWLLMTHAFHLSFSCPRLTWEAYPGPYAREPLVAEAADYSV